jgi:hypothetical protein
MKKMILLTVTAIVLSGGAKAQSIYAVNDRVKAYKAELANEKSADKVAENKTKEKLSQQEKTLRKIEDNQVDNQTRLNFSNDFGGITVLRWQHGPKYDVAYFTRRGNAMEAYYDTNSQLVGTITPKKFDDLPSGAKKEILKKYPGYSPVNTIYYDDNEDNADNFILDDDEFTADNYFVELANNDRHVVLRVQPDGSVDFFRDMK